MMFKVHQGTSKTAKKRRLNLKYTACYAAKNSPDDHQISATYMRNDKKRSYEAFSCEHNTQVVHKNIEVVPRFTK